MYVGEKHSICRVQDYQWFLASTGDLGTYPLDKGGLLSSTFWRCLVSGHGSLISGKPIGG